jgi:hypothetical protein
MSAWIPEGLPSRLRATLGALDRDIHAQLPHVGPAWQARTAALSSEGDPVSYFLHPEAFPSLLLPEWLMRGPQAPAMDAAARADALDAALQSTTAGYWAIRIVDQVMDEGEPADVALLPTLGLLLPRTWAPWQARLPPGHPFFDAALRCWSAGADAAVAELQAGGPARAAASSRKTAAAQIPLLGLCALAGLEGVPAGWDALREAIAGFHQRHNDLTDWRRDLDRGATTPLLEEAAARAGLPGPLPDARDERARRARLTAWMARGGASTLIAALHPALDAVGAAAQSADAPAAAAWARERRRRLVGLQEQVDGAARALRALFGPP